MMIISTTNVEQAKTQIKKALENKENPVIVQAQDDAFNRKLLEYGKFDILLDVEAGKRKDLLKQLDSGFNHVLAAIAAKNKVALGIDLAQLAKLEKKEKAIRLARIIQNLKIARRARVSITLINAQNKEQARSLLISLGASTEQTNSKL